jgi:hypothetical protein
LKKATRPGKLQTVDQVRIVFKQRVCILISVSFNFICRSDGQVKSVLGNLQQKWSNLRKYGKEEAEKKEKIRRDIANTRTGGRNFTYDQQVSLVKDQFEKEPW